MAILDFFSSIFDFFASVGKTLADSIPFLRGILDKLTNLFNSIFGIVPEPFRTIFITFFITYFSITIVLTVVSWIRG